MIKKNTIIGTFTSKKYERKDKFNRRINEEFREKIKGMYKHNFENKKETIVIIKYPVLDLEGNKIYDHQHKTNYPFLCKIKYKYVELKIDSMEMIENEKS